MQSSHLISNCQEFCIALTTSLASLEEAHSKCPTTLKLLYMFVTAPTTSVDPERSGSKLKLTLTRLRHLGHEVLANLMCVKANSPAFTTKEADLLLGATVDLYILPQGRKAKRFMSGKYHDDLNQPIKTSSRVSKVT